VPNGYFFKLILVWSRKIGSRFYEERWDLKKPAPPSLKTAPQPTKTMMGIFYMLLFHNFFPYMHPTYWFVTKLNRKE
jgi:hypothetical protein